MLPSEAFIAWLFELVPWMHTVLGISTTRGTVALPVEDDFPIDASLEGEELAADWLAFVAEHAGMSDWDVCVRIEEERGAAAALRGMASAMTRRVDGDHEGIAPPAPTGQLAIPVTVALLREPLHLVARLAHGLAHHRVQAARRPPPGDERAREAVVDIAAVFLGFGVFTANACHDTGALPSGAVMPIGFRVRRLGALGPVEVAYTLALRTVLVGAAKDDIEPHLRENPRAFFRDALRDLKKRDLGKLTVRSAGPYRES